MKKVLLMLLCGVMVLAAKFAMADARTDSLGLTAGQQVDDLDSIWMFPQDVASFNNILDYRLGNPAYANEGGGPIDEFGQTYDWGGVIEKDFSDIGVFGAYTNRPFNQNSAIEGDSSGVTENVFNSATVANQFGVFNGFVNWATMIDPAFTSYNNFGPGNGGTLYNYTGGFRQAWNQLNNTEMTSPDVTVMDPRNKADIFWAKDFGDVVLGAHFNYASSMNPYSGSATQNAPNQGGPDFEDVNNIYTANTQAFGLDLGATLKDIGTNMSLALDLGYSLATVDYLDTYEANYINANTLNDLSTDTIKDDNISELRLNALLKDKLTDTDTARVYLNGHLDSLGFNATDENDDGFDGTFTDAGDVYQGTSTYSDTNLNLGVAFDHNVEQGKAHVIASVGLIYDGRKWTQTGAENAAGTTAATLLVAGSGSVFTEDWWVVPINFAVEAPVFDWLTARMGASDTLYDNITDNLSVPWDLNAGHTAFLNTANTINNYNLENYWSNFSLYYGMNVHVQNFSLDLQVDPTALLNYLKGFAPGQGILYGNSIGTDAGQGYSSLGNLVSTFAQVDARYSF